MLRYVLASCATALIVVTQFGNQAVADNFIVDSSNSPASFGPDDDIDNLIIKDGGQAILLLATVNGNIMVRDASEVFVDFSLVKGNILVQGDSSLVGDNSTVEGNIVANDAFDVNLLLFSVNGNLLVKKADFAITLDSSTIGGNVILQRNTAEVVGIFVSDNDITGNLIATNNETISFDIIDNTINGNLICVNNDPEPTRVGNDVDGNTICQ